MSKTELVGSILKSVVFQDFVKILFECCLGGDSLKTKVNDVHVNYVYVTKLF